VFVSATSMMAAFDNGGVSMMAVVA